MKKICAALVIISLMLYNAAVGETEFVDIAAAKLSSAKSACILEEVSGRVLFEWNARERLPMASTTKIMTCLLALENSSLDDIVTTSKNAYGQPGTSIYLLLGETLSMRDMLTGLMLASGNDAAVAIAEHVGGTLAGFLDMMNARAQSLGAYDTHFNSPNGLPTDDHYTTAYDLALITREAMKHHVFRELVSTQRATIPWAEHDYDRVLTNKNRLLSDYEGATGVKTGFTNAAGRCLAFGAVRNGMEVVGVVLNCSDWFDESMRLMDKVFGEFTMLSLLRSGDPVRSVDITDGIEPTLPLILKGDLEAPFGLTESPNIRLVIPDSVRAPIKAGDTVGLVRLYAGDAVVQEREVIAARSVEQRSFLGGIRQILRHWLMLT
ncbi:MAG: D-alanyl-D-alanine carboxypeptidase [Oscillospiraceae bacterium]|jgi:D-alanyl-D-alanine carboxypeptidase (penicillin-binding protein 5/6)|nr:D-alanyl-D-alanine carboxypeptidase [Oscillospiraceae bacterium]